jgi:hypothetical protein
MTMPTFEPVAMRRIVLNRANKLATNSNFYIDGFEAYKMGNLVQAIFETIESQLQQAYEAGTRDAVPELEALRIKVAGQTAVIEKLRVALSETLECGEDGDWQSARRVISESLAATGATE